MMRVRPCRLLDAGGLQVFQHHRAKSVSGSSRPLGLPALALGGVEDVDQFVFSRRHDAMGRQAFDRERAGDADAGFVLIGPVVEDSNSALAAIEASISFWRAMRSSHHSGVHASFGGGVARAISGCRASRGFPILSHFLPSAALFNACAQRFELRLELLPDHVDLGIVGDGFERDVRRALVDEALADVAVRRLRLGRELAGDLRFFAAGPPVSARR